MLSLSVLLLGVLTLPSISARHVQFYRKDYTYVKEFDAFYKVHWDLNGISWNSAFLACDDEGATLFYPKVPEEWSLVKNLTNNMSDPPNVTQIFVGLHDEFNLGEFMTVDGHSTPFPLVGETTVPISEQQLSGVNKCVLLDIETGLYTVSLCQGHENSVVPFVCKKTDDESCPTIDQGYKYSAVTKKCYKVNDKHMMWQEAMQTCFMEGGTLLVLENQAQVDNIRPMLSSGNYYFVGIKQLFPNSELYSVKGQKFSTLYQRDYGRSQNFECGAIIAQDPIYTLTKDCGERLPFICEMEVTV